jgi:hypothetical protein
MKRFCCFFFTWFDVTQKANKKWPFQGLFPRRQAKYLREVCDDKFSCFICSMTMIPSDFHGSFTQFYAFLDSVAPVDTKQPRISTSFFAYLQTGRPLRVFACAPTSSPNLAFAIPHASGPLQYSTDHGASSHFLFGLSRAFLPLFARLQHRRDWRTQRINLDGRDEESCVGAASFAVRFERLLSSKQA